MSEIGLRRQRGREAPARIRVSIDYTLREMMSWDRAEDGPNFASRDWPPSDGAAVQTRRRRLEGTKDAQAALLGHRQDGPRTIFEGEGECCDLEGRARHLQALSPDARVIE